MRSLKKVVAIALAAAMTMGSVMTAGAAASPVEGKQAASYKNATPVTKGSGNVAKVNTSKTGVATVYGVKKSSKSVTVSTVTVKGVKYKVTAIAKNAFKGSKATTVTIKYNKKTVSVKKDAFKSSKVKTLKLTSFTKASQIKFSKNALKSSKIKTVKVSAKLYKNKKQLKALKLALKKAGLKNVKIKKA